MEILNQECTEIYEISLNEWRWVVSWPLFINQWIEKYTKTGTVEGQAWLYYLHWWCVMFLDSRKENGGKYNR